MALRIHEHCFHGQPLELEVGVPEGSQGQRDLLENAGYTVDRWFFVMKRSEDVPVPDVAGVVAPAGLAFEPYRDDVDDALLVTYNEAFVDHWHFTPSMPQTWQHAFRRNRHFRADLSSLLRDVRTGRIAGYLMASEYPAKAASPLDIHFAQIGTCREYRGRGVASALIARAVAQSRELGFRTASLRVDAENPSGALGVYERNGFACERRRIAYAKKLAG